MDYTAVSELIELLSAMAHRGDRDAFVECQKIFRARSAWRERQTSELWNEFLAASERAKTWVEENR